MRKILSIAAVAVFLLNISAWAGIEADTTQQTQKPPVVKPSEPAKIIHPATNWSKIKDLFM
jgi:hypothetical protein